MRPWICHLISLGLFLALQGGDNSNYLPPGGRERLNELMFMKYSVLSSVSTVVFYQLLIEYWMFFQFSWRQFQKFSSNSHILVHKVPIPWLELESPVLIGIFHFKCIANRQKHYPNKSPSKTRKHWFWHSGKFKKTHLLEHWLTSMLLISSKYRRSRTLVNAYGK